MSARKWPAGLKREYRRSSERQAFEIEKVPQFRAAPSVRKRCPPRPPPPQSKTLRDFRGFFVNAPASWTAVAGPGGTPLSARADRQMSRDRFLLISPRLA